MGLQWLATISPATYALRGIRGAVLDGDGLGARWDDLWPLLVLGAIAIPLGPAVFGAGERYAKRHGKLKRPGALRLSRMALTVDLIPGPVDGCGAEADDVHSVARRAQSDRLGLSP